MFYPKKSKSPKNGQNVQKTRKMPFLGTTPLKPAWFGGSKSPILTHFLPFLRIFTDFSYFLTFPRVATRDIQKTRFWGPLKMTILMSSKHDFTHFQQRKQEDPKTIVFPPKINILRNTMFQKGINLMSKPCQKCVKNMSKGTLKIGRNGRFQSYFLHFKEDLFLNIIFDRSTSSFYKNILW